MTSFRILLCNLPVFVATIVFVAGAESAERHQFRARLRCGVSTKYDYGHDDPRASVIVVSAPTTTPAETVDQAQGVVSAQTQSVTKTLSGSTETIVRRTISFDQTAHQVPLLRKRFILDEPAIDHIQLVRPGAVLYDTGQFVFSGLLLHSGGENGELLGNKVTIHVRALAAVPLDGVPPDRYPVLWETGKKFWLKRGTPTAVSIPEANTKAAAKHFAEITHIEVQLEYRKDR